MLAMSKEKLDEALAPIRAKRFKAQAALEQSKIETELLEKESKVQEKLTAKEPCLSQVLDILDEIALLERRKEQYDKVLEQLFPNDK
jgi:oligoendopeptidase F